jgi:hypothetical protein
MLTLTSCPECHAPAEITDRFTLASTDGPVAHVAVSCLAGHHFRMPADKLPWPADPAPRRRLALQPHRFQLCVRCQANPAGFWVSGTASSVTRRPWCLTCCEHLDRTACHITPFVP